MVPDSATRGTPHTSDQETDDQETDDQETEIVTTNGRAVSLVLDFGQIVSGRLQFDVEGAAGALIDFTYGERVDADGKVRSIAGIPGLDAPIAHRYILADGGDNVGNNLSGRASVLYR